MKGAATTLRLLHCSAISRSVSSQDSGHDQPVRALREQVLPWLRQGTAHLVLAQPPLQLPPAITAVPIRTPLLRLPRQPRSHEVLAHWVKVGLVAVRNPRFAIVLEGEADLKIGITEKMVGRNSAVERTCGIYTLQLPARSILILPPGTPLPDGFHPHWDRPDPDAAHSRILWMTVMTGGIKMHLCETQGLAHTTFNSSTLGDTRFSSLVELLIDTLQERATHSLETATALLLALLLSITRESHCPTAVAHGQLPGRRYATETAPMLPRAQIVQRACDYIDAHFGAGPSAADIAGHVYVSVSHLNRLFHIELGMTIIAYLTARRIEVAKSLLQTTDLSVRDISVTLGYAHPNYLSYVFSRGTGESPLEFRRRCQQSLRKDEQIV